MTTSLMSQLIRRFDRPRWEASRRDVLRASLAAGAGLLLAGPLATLARAGLSDSRLAEPAGPTGPRRKVIIVGAGFAGLSCAHELITAGHDVVLFDARTRVGGRVLSMGDYVAGKNIEGGAEFIGSNHPAWLAYAKKFDLTMSDVSAHDDLSSPIIIDGQRLSEAEAGEVYEKAEAALRTLNAHALATNADEPWKTEQAQEWDVRSMGQWLEELDTSAQTKRLVRVMMEADNAQQLERMSYLGFLSMLKGGGVERFWAHSEDFRCKGGNQQLAQRFSDAIGADRIRLGTPISRIDLTDNSGTVSLLTASGERIDGDEVVLACAPSVYSKISFGPPDLSREIMAARVQMGSAWKFFASVDKPFWLDDKTSPYAFSDGPMNLTWDATDGQDDRGPGAVLAGFSGGPSAEILRALPASDQKPAGLAALAKIYPGLETRTPDVRFMNWPSDAWTRGSYSFPSPGQITAIGPVLRRGLRGGFKQPRLHFAGEHTCHAFAGYMEGGLQSGIAAAKRIVAQAAAMKP
ncbi:MAG: FAD-dependent oxidoreductase [Phycisphaerales bacterium]|nr:FAD-dependent oxidoreductase [Phycisphaerales bacterium]